MRTLLYFYSNATPTAATYTLSLHDAFRSHREGAQEHGLHGVGDVHAERARRRAALRIAARHPALDGADFLQLGMASRDRKSTRLNSSHMSISYAVFCLKKKNKQNSTTLA